MEIVLQTTTADYARYLQSTLAGRTMSGEALEQRPIVQLTDAADFLDAALRVYRITKIRLAPSTQKDSQVEVIAEYEREWFRCEVCGKEVDRPRQFSPMHTSEYHCWCASCSEPFKTKLTQEVMEERQKLGDPVTTCMTFLLRQQRPVLPHALHRLLTQEELREVSHRLWSIARGGLLSVLVQQVTTSGVYDLDSLPLPERIPPRPFWKRGDEYLEYIWDDRRRGFLAPLQGDWLSHKKGDFQCLVETPHTPHGRTHLAIHRKLRDAKHAVEEYWRQAEAVEAIRLRRRDTSDYAFRLLYDLEFYLNRRARAHGEQDEQNGG